MSDPLSITASVLAVADAGLKVATKLYEYVNAVHRAPRSIQQLALEVSLTSNVLSDVGKLLKTDGAAQLISSSAITSAQEAVNACEQIFNEIGEEIEKAGGGVGIRKYVWPLMESKVQLLMAGLERGKTLLLLMLNVITLAKQVSDQKTSEVALKEQRILILELERKNEESKRKYEFLRNILISSAYVATHTSNSGPFPPPKPTLTGDTTVGIESPDISKGQAGSNDTCLCGQSSDTNANHISSDELEQYQSKFESYFDTINAGRKNLGKIILPPGLGCEGTRSQLDGIVENLELLMLWQVMAIYERAENVVIQEPATETYVQHCQPSNPPNERIWEPKTSDRQKTTLVGLVRKWARLLFRRESKAADSTAQPTTQAPTAIIPQSIQYEIDDTEPGPSLIIPISKIQKTSEGTEIVQPRLWERPANVALSPGATSGLEGNVTVPYTAVVAEEGGQDEELNSRASVNRLLEEWTTLDKSKIKESETSDI